MANPPDRVIIIGAGIGGLTAGIALSRIGAEVTVFEASGELREIGAGLGIQYAAMKALRQVGLSDDARKIGEPLLRMEWTSWNGRRLTTIPHAEITRKLGTQTLNIHRGEFLRLLVRELGRDRVVLGARCVGFDEDETGVTAHFADGRTARGTMLVGADGPHSVIRQRVLHDGEPRASDIVVWRAMPHFEHLAIPPGVLRTAYGRGKFFATIAGTEGRVFWFAGGLVSENGEQSPTRAKEGGHGRLRKLARAGRGAARRHRRARNRPNQGRRPPTR